MELTQAQRQAVESLGTRRITVVRASPGSGKTRLFVESLRRELGAVSSSLAGVAALSFTNVAHKEVSARLGGNPGSPHFVGTLDSFYFRYILRPFGPALGIPTTGARLVPEPQAQVLYEPQVKTGRRGNDRCNLFKISFCGGTEDAPVLEVDDERMRRRRVLSGGFTELAVRETAKEYKGTGRVSHSGVNYLASSLLSGQHADAIARRIEARFPVILIDEVQDTGFFAGRALCSLLARSTIRCLIVGDPDQTIFKFSGASPDLFERLEQLDGASSHTLAASHRCPKRVAAVGSCLSRSGKGVECSDGANKGDACLAVYDSPKPRVQSIMAALGWGEQSTMILVRRNSTARELLGREASSGPPGKAVRAMIHRAAVRLRDGDTVGAAKAISVAMGRVVFSEPILGREDLVGRGVGWSQWRRLCHAVLFEAAVQKDETWGAWLERVRSRVADSCERFGVHLQKKIGIALRSFGKDEAEKTRCLASPPSELQLGTIHSVKGQEFLDVLFVVPKPRRPQRPCPSVSWWLDDEGSEEREIAFVACTRAKERLALAVHRSTFDALREARPEFVELFTVVDVP